MTLKKIVKFVKNAKNFFIVLGLPVVLYYAYQIHEEQLKNKDLQIDLLKTRVENLQDGQIDEVWDKYKSLKEFNEAERAEFKDKLKKEKNLNDSLKKYFSGATIDNKNRIVLTLEVAKKITIDLIEGDKNKQLVKTYIDMDQNSKKRISISNSMINNLRQMNQSNEKVITQLKKVIEIQDKLLNKK